MYVLCLLCISIFFLFRWFFYKKKKLTGPTHILSGPAGDRTGACSSDSTQDNLFCWNEPFPANKTFAGACPPADRRHIFVSNFDEIRGKAYGTHLKGNITSTHHWCSYMIEEVMSKKEKEGKLIRLQRGRKSVMTHVQYMYCYIFYYNVLRWIRLCFNRLRFR